MEKGQFGTQTEIRGTDFFSRKALSPVLPQTNCQCLVAFGTKRYTLQTGHKKLLLLLLVIRLSDQIVTLTTILTG